MRYTFAIVAAAGLALGTASEARAQFSLAIGNPYGGGVYVGSSAFGYPGYGYGYGIGSPYGAYSSGYYGLASPYTYGYSSGYYGVPGVYSSGYYGVGYPRTYGYGYGYPRAYGYGYGYPRTFGYGYGRGRVFGGRRFGRWW